MPAAAPSPARNDHARARSVRLVVTQVRSSIGTKPKTRRTLRALGLRRPGQSNDLPDRQEIRGMLSKVSHLVQVEEAGEPVRAGGGRS